VTHLRKMTLEGLQRRNYSEITTRKYLQYVTVFARHFAKFPDQLVSLRLIGPRNRPVATCGLATWGVRSVANRKTSPLVPADGSVSPSLINRGAYGTTCRSIIPRNKWGAFLQAKRKTFRRKRKPFSFPVLGVTGMSVLGPSGLSLREEEIHGP